MSTLRANSRQRRLGRVSVAILEGLYQHRLLSTGQIQALFMPEVGVRYCQRILSELRCRRLIGRVRGPEGMGVWYLEPHGALVVEANANRVETRRKQLTREQAEGPLQAHTLGVNDIGITFVKAARERGHECGPSSWRHEIAHPLGPVPGKRRPEQLISDAVLTYQLSDPDRSSFHYRFVELDRANRSVDDLAARLARYSRLYHRRVPVEGQRSRTELLWPKLYPAFPALLVVLAGRSSVALERRRDILLGISGQHPDLKATPQVEITVCLLEDLLGEGPFASIFRTLTDPDMRVDWLGQSETGRGSS